MDLSVIVPVFNEEENIDPLYGAVHATLSRLNLDYEIVLVDDGSADHTFARAAALTAKDAHVRVIKLRRNYGQTPAMAAGLACACGRVLITMDGDMQNDPADIPRFLDKIAEGYDLVVGWRYKRQDKLVSRKIPSMIANRMIGRITGVPIRDNGCSLKAYRASMIKSVPLYSEMHRFIPAMASTVGCRIAEIRVRHHARKFGRSKYGLSRVYKVLLDMLVIKALISFAYRPLLWFSALAVPAALAGIVMIFAALLKAFGDDGTLSLPVSGAGVLFCALAVFLLVSGAVGELVAWTTHAPVRSMALVTATVHEPRACGASKVIGRAS
ncbi:MAG: glycosyltransferase family 2 protein [Aquisalimonadaceae bacterium]